MTTLIPEPDYERAAELANAMRAGLDEFQSAPVAPGSHSPSSPISDLAAYADLRSLPPLARPGQLTSQMVRTARTLLRALLRPWLAVQSEFNQGIMAELDLLRRRIAELETNSHAAMMPGAMPVALHGHEAGQDQAVP